MHKTCRGSSFPRLARESELLTFHSSIDTAQEIVAGLGEIAGAARAEGLREILEISEGGGGQKKGQILYDFMAQGTYLQASNPSFPVLFSVLAFLFFSPHRTGLEPSAQETCRTAY